MSFLPVFLGLSVGRGGAGRLGSAGRRKASVAARVGRARALVLAGVIVEEQALLAGHYAGHIGVTIGEPQDADISGALALVSAAGDEIDTRVAARARALGVPVNVVDRLDLSTFIFPAIVNRGDVVVAIGTGGASPVLARRIRERIEAILPARIGEFAALMKRHREAIVPRGSAGRDSRRGASGSASSTAPSAPRSWLAARERPRPGCRAIIASAGAVERQGRWRGASGGRRAGRSRPADAARACRCCRMRMSYFYDELVTPEILERSRRDAERVFVGKRKGEPGIGQDEINRRLIAAAKAGKQVVRLKSGDPFVFGRGGEELEQLRAGRHSGVRRAGHHRGARLCGGGRAAADIPQGGDAAELRHRNTADGAKSD